MDRTDSKSVQPGETPGSPATLKGTAMQGIIKKALEYGALDRSEVCALLQAQGEDEQRLFAAAEETRRRRFGDRIFLYGFVYFSTHCRNDCSFCYYRRSNRIGRYRKSPEELLAIADALAAEGVGLLDLTMGEDPLYHAEGFETVLQLLEKIKERTGLPVMISPGVVSHALIDRFASRDVEWYALYQETYSRRLYGKLRLDQSFDERMAAKLYARDKGMHIEEGLMVGIGETQEELADSILAMSRIGADQLRVMRFVPQEGIPLMEDPEADRRTEQKTIAILRLLNPDALIPASLDVDGLAGLEERLRAGANVVTSIIPPHAGLAGVAQSTMDIDDGGRTVAGVSRILADLGLRAATPGEYRDHLRRMDRGKGDPWTNR